MGGAMDTGMHPKDLEQALIALGAPLTLGTRWALAVTAAALSSSASGARRKRSRAPSRTTFAMPPRRSTSFPLHFDDPAAGAPARAGSRHTARLALAAWAAAAYLVYWLGYLGLR